jgi:hypothetical protein
MDFSPRRLPWLLALVGAVHGFAAGRAANPFSPRYTQPDNTIEIVFALVFAAALFLAGWLHVNRRASHRRDLPAAAAKILLCCGAVGVIPGMLFGYYTWPLAVLGVAGAFAIGAMALPSALLLIHAHSEMPAPRSGSLFTGSDRAEEALSILGALVLLPWYWSAGSREVALILALAALPAIAIGLHAIILSKQTSLLAAAFPNAAAARSENAAIVCDIGFGGEERELFMKPVNAYRGNASRRTVACLGSVERGSRAARRLLWWTVAVGGAVLAQAGWLLFGRSSMQ